MLPAPTGKQPHSHITLNKVVTHLLRAPLHPLISRNLMPITFTGRTSGRPFTTPLTYLCDGDTIRFFSDRRWWRNLEDGAPVTLQLHGRVVQGLPRWPKMC